MPKRTTRTARVAAKTQATVPWAMQDFSFQEGDVVLDAEDRTRVGRVCTVVNVGRSYQVRFAASPICMLTAHDVLVPAPPATHGPACTPDC